jgi:hypothetical protein
VVTTPAVPTPPPSAGPSSARPAPSRARTWLRRLALVGFAVAAPLLAAWAVLAITFSNLPWPWARTTLAVLWLLSVVGVVWAVRPWRRAMLAFAGLWLAVLAWYLLIPPSNTRAWQPDVAQVARPTISGDTLTIRNVRNFAYRSETDFDAHWETRTYDLRRLRSMDIMFVYWGSPAIAHVMVSFIFDPPAPDAPPDRLCVSVEVRKEIGEGYDALKGFFRQFELIYIFADERDLVGLRTHHRGEQVYLYQSRAAPAFVRRLLEQYAARAADLADHPAWYNALTSNCFTNVIELSRLSVFAPSSILQYLDYRIVLAGYGDRLLYAKRSLDPSLPFEELRDRSLINPRATAAPIDANFSDRIRVGLPRPAQRLKPGDP